MSVPNYQRSKDQPRIGDAPQNSLAKVVSQGFNNQGSIPMAAADYATASTNTAVTLTYASAGTGVAHTIRGVDISYSAAPTGGKLQVKDGTTVVYELDIVGTMERVRFPNPIKGTTATALNIVLASGGSGITGKVNGVGHTTES